MTPLNSERKGEIYIFFEAILWGLFPVITILTFSELPALYSAAFSTFMSSLLFALILTVRRGWKQWSRAPWMDIFIASLFIGIILYAIEFTALKYTTAGNASIMNLMEIFFAFVILSLILKHERFRLLHVAGAACMVAGAVIILFPKASGWHAGDAMIVVACIFAPIGNRFAKRARAKVSAEFILFFRSIISGFFLLLLAFMIEPPVSSAAITSSLPLIFVNGFVLFGLSKILWAEGMYLIPITKAISLASIAPLFTLVFALFLLHEQVQLYQLAAIVPILCGVILLTRETKKNVVLGAPAL